MKYQLVCKKCGKVIPDFATWFQNDQHCSCGSNHAEVVYPSSVLQKLKSVDWEHLSGDSFLDLYFDFLPLLSRDNIVSFGEGAIPIERWTHLEEYALQHYGIQCQTFVYRNDLNAGTGTFKDIAAALAASVMKENGVTDYCLASTGNAATAYAAYLAKANIRFTEFAPCDVESETIEAIRRCGQEIVISKGGYGAAKAEAAAFHDNQHVMISAGNIDPLRVEAKRTMVFEFLRQLGALPTVYMQAVAGGTGPIALDKGFRDLSSVCPGLQFPRLLLVQQDLCDPMVRAWEKAQANNFPEGYENDYQPISDLRTRISILTAANPGMYPKVAPMVRQSGGTFLRVAEAQLPEFGRDMLRNRNILMGPAAMVCYAGFFKALHEGQIRNGDRVLLNTGEGSARAQWFVNEVKNTPQQ